MKLRFKVISKATLQKTFFESLYFFGEIDMLLLRNLQNINTVIVLGGLALCLIFMVQVKQLYHKNQKYNRYLGYKQYMTEISSEMSIAEKTVNKSAAYVRQLSKALAKHEKELRNASMSGVTIPN